MAIATPKPTLVPSSFPSPGAANSRSAVSTPSRATVKNARRKSAQAAPWASACAVSLCSSRFR